jgi:hypothetical protein
MNGSGFDIGRRKVKVLVQTYKSTLFKQYNEEGINKFSFKSITYMFLVTVSCISMLGRSKRKIFLLGGRLFI